jgi:glycosyltransferase involved in cell wall biosynthesis
MTAPRDIGLSSDEMRTRLLVISWARFQPRSAGLAKELGGEARFVYDERLAARRSLTPVRYFWSSVQTWRLLARADPEHAIVISPPVFAPLVVYAWCRLHGRRLYVDCHTDVFDPASVWRWARRIHRWLLPRASAALLHTEAAAARVAGWGGRALLVPDDVPSLQDAAVRRREPGVTIVVAGSLDGNEPVAATLAAAARLPDYRFRFTGDPRRLSRALIRQAPLNVVWTGYLPYEQFLGELLAADAVAVFSTEPGIMNRAAFEAVGLGRPLVLTDFEGLRSRFGRAALFAPNQPDAMARALDSAVRRGPELEARSAELSKTLAAHRRQALADLLGRPATGATRAPGSQ